MVGLAGARCCVRRSVDRLAAEPQDPEQLHSLAAVPGGARVTRGSRQQPRVAAIQTLERSATFRQLVATINGTDGIVYVHHDRCGRDVLACLVLGVTQAGPYRILHIRVDKTDGTRSDGLYRSRTPARRRGSERTGVVDTNSAAPLLRTRRADRAIQLRNRGSHRDRAEGRPDTGLGAAQRAVTTAREGM